MESKVKTVMGIIIIIGIITQGIFGIPIGIFLSSIIGIIYGIIKKNRSFVLWSFIALIVDLACIITFIILLVNSNM